MRGVDQQEDGDGGGLPLRQEPLQPREQGGGTRDDPRHQAGTVIFPMLLSVKDPDQFLDRIRIRLFKTSKSET